MVINCDNIAFSYNKQNFHSDIIQRIMLYLLFVFILVYFRYRRYKASMMYGFQLRHFRCTARMIKHYFKKKYVTVMCNINSHLKDFPSCSTTSELCQPLFLPHFQDSILSLKVSFQSCNHVST